MYYEHEADYGLGLGRIKAVAPRPLTRAQAIEMFRGMPRPPGAPAVQVARPITPRSKADPAERARAALIAERMGRPLQSRKIEITAPMREALAQATRVAKTDPALKAKAMETVKVAKVTADAKLKADRLKLKAAVVSTPATKKNAALALQRAKKLEQRLDVVRGDLSKAVLLRRQAGIPPEKDFITRFVNYFQKLFGGRSS